MDFDYQVKLQKPGGSHKGYRLYKFWPKRPRGEKLEYIESSELDHINEDLKAGKLNPAEAHRLALVIRENAKRHRDAAKGLPVLFFHDANNKLLSEYIDNEYRHREHKPKSYRTRVNDLRRAVGMMQQVSLRAATREDVVAQLKRVCDDPSRYNRMVGCLNSVLKYARRDFKLYPVAEDYSDIVVFTVEEINGMTAKMTKEQRLQCRVAFACGLRPGETLAVEEKYIKTNPKTKRSFYWVERQWNIEEGRYTPPKRNKKRDALILPDFLDDVKAWAKIPLERRLEIPYPPIKGGTLYDFRHSYATYLLRQGVSLSLVARFLGNTLKVTEQYYASYTFGDDLQLPDGL